MGCASIGTRETYCDNLIISKSINGRSRLIVGSTYNLGIQIYLDFFSSAEEPAELPSPPDFDRLLRLLPDDRLLLGASPPPPDFADDLSDPESDDEPEPLEPLDEDDEDPLEDDPEPELEDEPSSPVPSSSDEEPPADADDADREFLPPPVEGLLGGISNGNVFPIKQFQLIS